MQTLPSWVKVGQKVVCVDNTDHNNNATYGGWVQPALDTPYTIQAVNLKYPNGVPHIVLFELPDAEDLGGVWSGYDWRRFKPLITTEAKKTVTAQADMDEHFKKLLEVPVDEKVN